MRINISNHNNTRMVDTALITNVYKVDITGETVSIFRTVVELEDGSSVLMYAGDSVTTRDYIFNDIKNWLS